MRIRLALLVLLAALVCANVSSAAGAELGITVLATSQDGLPITDPDIAGDWVVWLEQGYNDWPADVCAMNLVTKQKVVLAHDRLPVTDEGVLCTDGSGVAWLEHETASTQSETEVWYADLATGEVKRLTDDSAFQDGLSIGEGHVIWCEDSQASTQTLVAYDVSSETTTGLFTDRLVAGTAVADGAAYFFVAEDESNVSITSLRSVPLAGGADTIVVDEAYTWFKSTLSASDDSLVWRSRDAVFSAPRVGGAAVPLSLGPDWPYEQDAGDRFVAWSARGPWDGIDRIVVWDAASGLAQPIYAGDVWSGPAVDGARCVWADGPKLFTADVTELPAALRISGRNRIETGLSAVQSEYHTARTVVFASGYSSADALSAAGLAGATDGAVILVGPTSPYGVASEVIRLRPERILIVGGQSAVPDASVATACWQAEAQLGTTTERIAGRTRYDTSRLVNDRILAEGGDPATAFVVRGDDFSDGLSVSPAAYQLAARIFLVEPAGVPAATASALTTMPAEAVIVGGLRAVGTPVEEWFESRGVEVTRVAGATRFSTNVQFADHAIDQGWLTATDLGICNGLAYPDALSGGATMGHAGGPMLYVTRTMVPTETAGFLSRREVDVRSARGFGGTNVISESVMTWIEDHIPQPDE